MTNYQVISTRKESGRKLSRVKTVFTREPRKYVSIQLPRVNTNVYYINLTIIYFVLFVPEFKLL